MSRLSTTPLTVYRRQKSVNLTDFVTSAVESFVWRKVQIKHSGGTSYGENMIYNLHFKCLVYTSTTLQVAVFGRDIIILL